MDFTKKIKLHNIYSLNGLGIVLIFLSGFLNPLVVTVIYAFFLIINIKKVKIDNIFVPIFILLLIHSALTIMLKTDTVFFAFRQVLGISIGLIYWSTALNDNNYMTSLILYKNMTVIAAVVGLFQSFFSFIGINSLSNFSIIIHQQSMTTGGRIASFLSEPSAFVLIIFPIFFLILYSWFGKNKALIKMDTWQKIVIVLAYILAFSTVGYIGIFIAMIFIILEYKINFKQMPILALTILILVFLYKNVSFFQQRVDDSFDMLMGTGNIFNSDLSTQTIIINKNIAIESFRKTWGLGGGIGSHLLSYNKYINNFYIPYGTILLNKDDANSLLLRIISELGIIGIVVLLGFIIKYKVKKTGMFKIISSMCLAYMLLRLVRMGHYFNYGFGLFLVMYYRIYFESLRYK